MEYVSINEQNRTRITAFITKRWYSSVVIIRGKAFDMTKADGIIAMECGEIAGLITYELRGDTCEILTLDSIHENRGVGTALIRRMISLAREHDCRRIILISTNDNMRAIRFYQRLGFDMTRFFRNALEVSRTLKPEIPLTGEDGIPLRHEIEFEFLLQEPAVLPAAPGFWTLLDRLLATSELVIDRPKGTAHPRYPDFIYPVDYGYLKDTAAMDGNGIDVWRGTGDAQTITAIAVTADLLKRDSEIKILIGCTAEEQQMILKVHNETKFMKGILIPRF